MIYSFLDCLKGHCLVSNQPNAIIKTDITMYHVLTDEAQWEFETFLLNLIPNEVFQVYDEVLLHFR